ncbi:MAG: replicative DNA helicase [Leadbetterella sp.]
MSESIIKSPFRSQVTFNSAKVTPFVLEMEQAVLGAILIDKDAYPLIMDQLNESSFYDEKHQIIYTAIKELFSKFETIDTVSVIRKLRFQNLIAAAGNAKYLATISNMVNSAANIEFHVAIVAQNSIKREMIKTASFILEEGFSMQIDALDLLNNTEQSFFRISEKNIRKQYLSSGEVIKTTVKELELKKKNNKEGVTGVSSGFKDFDALTGGWQKSELSIIAARPGMGKTAFVVSAMRNAAVDHNVPVALFSLEMSASQLMTRLISAEAEIDSEKLRKANLAPHEWEQLHTRVKKLSKSPIFIDDTPALSILDLRAKCRRLKSTHNIQMVIIDYLQLMTGDTGEGVSSSREQEIATISRALKNLSKELDIPVIALSQLSRSLESRPDKRPQLSDLRESGSIEQDADMVMFLYRPEYYKIMEDELGNSTEGLGELIIAKNRAGTTDNIKLQFIGKYTKYTNFGEGYSASYGTGNNSSFAQNSGVSSFEGQQNNGNSLFKSFGSRANKKDEDNSSDSLDYVPF